MNSYGNRKLKKILLLIVAIILIIIGCGFLGYNIYSEKTVEKGKEQISSVLATTKAQTAEDTVDNPYDFKDLQSKNEEIYSWIKVPNTNVDYPVVQNAQSNEFYLKHEALDKRWSASGAIYSEMINTTTYEDRVTVLYGHNGYSDTMFTTLHKFEKQDFFDENEYFYIYTPSSKLTYKIVSAFKYDDRHIMNSFDFQSDDIFLEFLYMIQNPTSSNKKVRNIGRTLTTDDCIVVLSTCITNQDSSRYLVCGVLEKNEKTN